MTNPEKQGPPPVTFTFDGTEHSSEKRRMSAAAVLRDFGELDPTDYDLIRAVGQGQEQRFRDEDEVELVPGGKYLSLFTGSMPVE